MGIRAVLQTSHTRQTSSESARDDAKLCLRNPNQQPSWLGWRECPNGLFHSPGAGESSGAAVQWGSCHEKAIPEALHPCLLP